MTDTQARALTTTIIWIIFAAIAITALVAGQRVDDGVVIATMISTVIACLAGTNMVWRGTYGHDGAIAEAEKTKRRTRVERVLDSMDERELDELRARLSESDGEMISLDDVLAERRNQR
jgi:multisubunit Na+/H+ antiporter MnhF subunit